MKQLGLSGATPLGEFKAMAPNSNHRDVPPAPTRQAEVARDYLKRAASIGELNGHPPGSDGPEPSQTRTRANTTPYGTEASAAG